MMVTGTSPSRAGPLSLEGGGESGGPLISHTARPSDTPKHSLWIAFRIPCKHAVVISLRKRVLYSSAADISQPRCGVTKIATRTHNGNKALRLWPVCDTADPTGWLSGPMDSSAPSPRATNNYKQCHSNEISIALLSRGRQTPPAYLSHAPPSCEPQTGKALGLSLRIFERKRRALAD